ncbi:MAG: phenylalanine--tRNA ligase subunit alpha [Bacilli bacterium]|nr:phenylalanine--tRNA ligase subunit alpha [Bacilli bacterium]
MIDQLQTMLQDALSQIASANSQLELGELKANFLGKKSPLSEIMKKMGSMSPEERKTFGMKANEFKVQIENALNARRTELERLAIAARLASEHIDVTLPGRKLSVGSLHPLTKTIEEVEDFFIGMGYNIAEGPEVELDLYNFEMLNVPKGHPARDMQDSFYILDNLLLRTQTSPVQARTLLVSDNKPVKILCPGKVYRRDDDDATHSHQFMQFEGLVVGSDITMSDLKGTLEAFMRKMFGPTREIRFRPSYFPFTEPSVEVDVSCFKCGGKGCPLCKGNGWIEVLGAGMVHPNVLTQAGYDAEKMRGFAFGVGIERVVMLKYGIDDIRHLYTNDIRFLKQFERGE